LAVADAAFRPHRGPRLAATAPGRLRVGRMGAGLGDEVVAVVVDGPIPGVEVQCHGGPAPLALVVEALIAAGAEVAEPGDWAEAESTSRISAEAQIDLAGAPTVRTAEILLDQVRGTLDDEIRKVVDQLSADPATAATRLETLIGRAAVGLRLLGGWRVVLAGRPNVGKSRLLNALAGYDRAIVDPTPGTTRDVVTVRTAFAGWPVELADTAGLRPTTDPTEAAGVALARARQAEADLVALVLDLSEPLTPADLALREAHPGALLIANKADLPAAWEPGPAMQVVSAQRGDGIEALIAAIAARLVPEPPAPGAAVPFRPGHALAFEQARQSLLAGDSAAARIALEPLVRPAHVGSG
jgi:tRNA modification GTPase